jgi:D-serine deaminase-like pyridoxal phosphate-dependent protein
MQPVDRLVQDLLAEGIKVPKLVCGGTPTFPVYASLDSPHTAIECSPGTCVLSDFNYGKDYADMSGIQKAAVLMTRVISTQHPGHLTTDLGNKAVASDPPAGHRCHFLNLPDAIEEKHNEEHLVIASQKASDFRVGDVLYALPAHICPTVALHSHLQVVEGGQLMGSWIVSARDRIY